MLAPGTRLRRREPTGDAWDNVCVSGYFDLGETQEVVISLAVGFASPILASPESLLKAYTIDVSPPKPMSDWSTPAAEVTA